MVKKAAHERERRREGGNERARQSSERFEYGAAQRRTTDELVEVESKL